MKQMIQLSQLQINILICSSIRALVRNGTLTKESITAEISQQGVPPELAFLLWQYIQEIPMFSEDEPDSKP